MLHYLQSEDFPMTVEMLLNILEIGKEKSKQCLKSTVYLFVLFVVTPFKHLKKLREFVTMKLPPGFPVKIGMQIKSAYLCMNLSLNLDSCICRDSNSSHHYGKNHIPRIRISR